MTITRLTSCVLLCAAAAAALLGTARFALADDARRPAIDLMRQRLVALYTGSLVPDRADGPLAAAARADLDRRADRLIQSDFAQPRPHLQSPAEMPYDVAAFYDRLLTLAQAWAAPGGKHSRSPDLLARIVALLEEGLQWTAPGSPRPGNWYPWKISTPQKLGPALILLDGAIDPALCARCADAMTYLVGEADLSGANAVWDARNRCYLGLVRRDPDLIDAAWNCLLPELTVHDESGILEDYSFQFHGRLLHTAGYGGGFAESAAQLIHLAEGTPWEVSRPKKDLLARHLVEHCRWVIVGDRYDLSVKGRRVLDNEPALPHLAATLLLAQCDTSHRDALRQAAAELLARTAWSLPLDVARTADAVTDPKAQPLVGFRHFYASDFAVMRTRDFYASVRMYSNRLIDYEGNWGENLSGWFLCYGLTYISRTGNELYADAATLREHFDWDRLPGTTVRLGVHPPSAYNTGTEPLAGGAGLDRGGICAFRLVPAAGDFVARKSYFFFDEGFLALGSGIASTADRPEPIITTVTQWAAPRADLPLVLSGDRCVEKIDGQSRWDDVAWAWHDGIGYVFLQSVTLCGQRRGAVTTLWLDHGNAPADARYAYVVLPRATLEQTRAFAAEPYITVPACDDKVHVCRDERRGTAGVVFWRAAVADEGITDGPAVIYGEPTDNAGLVMAVANPLHTQTPLTITGDTSMKPDWLPPGVTATQADDVLRIVAQTAMGRNYRLRVSGEGSDATPVPQQPREDLLPYADFAVAADTEGRVTHLTVRLPAVAVKEGFRLLIRGPQGHLLAELTDGDVQDRPEPNVIRCRWTRTAERALAGGRFTAELVAPLHSVSAPFTVPPAQP
jgi:chondroitin AC lyase